jgi:DNA primase catalytic subunit
MRYADAECRSLVQQLDEAPVDVLASGGRGVHVYYEDHGDVRERVVKLSRERAIRLDENVTTSLKSTVALPGSLRAGSMQLVESIMEAAREVTQCS